MDYNLSCISETDNKIKLEVKSRANTDILKLQNNFFCFVIIFQQFKKRVNIFSELLNECKEKPYRVYLLSSHYNYHIYLKAPTLASSFHELYNDISLVAIVTK